MLHMCPPAIKSIKVWKEEICSYTNAILVSKVYLTHSGYDFKAWFEGIRDFQKTLVGVKDDFEAQCPDKRFFRGGGLCERCTYQEGNPAASPKRPFLPLRPATSMS